MKVDIEASTSSMALKKLLNGNYFWYEDWLYVKLNRPNWSKLQKDEVPAFCVCDGRLTYFSGLTQVTPEPRKLKVVADD